ncbi:hypothetical protein JHK82_041594 [Glycine max]|nr:hypothetical protein JHK82_041594 [Glycine max]KAG5115748.1 hypothetical protein JHK84_041861 [Glycine max]
MTRMSRSRRKEADLGEMKDGKSFPRMFSGRPIPKRGQVKVAVVLGLAHSIAAIFCCGANEYNNS